MEEGRIKFYSPEKGWGFIQPDHGGDDVFLHASSVKSSGLASVAEGAKVRYELAAGKSGKGPKAINLQLA